MSYPLLCIPNISEGSTPDVVASVRAAYESSGAVVLDETSDADHGRSVHTLTGSQSQLSQAIVSGWKAAAEGIDLRDNRGVHPNVGVLDVAPFVYLDESERGAACSAALTAAGQLGLEGCPVFMYGLLAGGRTRAELRIGGCLGLASRVESGDLNTDFGPNEIDPRSGAVLVSARPPLIAFNLRLAPGESLDQAKLTAAAIREGGRFGLVGVKALAFELKEQGFVQLSFNLESPDEVGIGELVAVVRERHGVESGELIGLTLRRYIDSIPDDLEMPGFDPDRKSVEGSLRFNGIEI